MTDSKFYRFLLELELTELKRFRKYLESPYFNSHPKIFRLFELLELHLLSKNTQDLHKETIWDELYPDEQFDDERLRKLLHNLMTLGYKFLAQQVYDYNQSAQAHFLLEMFADKHKEERILSTINSVMLTLNKSLSRNGLYYYDLYAIEKYKYILANVESTRIQKSTLDKLNLEPIDHNLNIFYISEKLRNYCLLLSWQQMVSINTAIPLIKEIIDLVQSSDYKEVPAINIYYYIYLTYSDPEDNSHYFSLKNSINEHIHLFPPNEARDILNAAINYTIRKHSSGNRDFYQENFDLYKTAIRSGTILINNEISPWAFKNIVSLGVALNQLDWTENFIKEYGQKIIPEHKENSLNFNLAVFYFYKKDYPKAIQYSQIVQFDEITYGLGIRNILLQSYYELDEFEALNSLIESFKQYLRRTKAITAERKSRYFLLINFTLKLTSNSTQKNRLNLLKQEIEKSNAMSKSWLLEKVDELL